MKGRRRTKGNAEMPVEDWLRSEGILKDPPRPPRIKRQVKSIPGQQSLLEVGDDGRPLVLKTTDKKKRQ